MSKPKIFVVGAGNNAKYMVDWYEKNGLSVTYDVLTADILQFMGGEDVTPQLYGEENTHSYNNMNRDITEMGYFHYAHAANIPMVGICRGAQFLNVMCGGKMVQDVKGHTRDHDLHIIPYGKDPMEEIVIKCTSTHHQMMKPDYDFAELLAYADIVCKDGIYDPEVLFYGGEKCLCFQPHPEYQIYPELEKFYFGLIHQLLLG